MASVGGDLRWTAALVLSLSLALADACSDRPSWADSHGDTCAVYAARGYCSIDGSPGRNWDPARGVLADYAADGISAADACCACGGGCSDGPVDWVDSLGEGCSIYASSSYCIIDGSMGPGWEPAWGTLADYAVSGISASEACCACGGGVARGYCQDDPPAWVDSLGEGCVEHEVKDYCTVNGTFGAGWDPDWGTFADYAVNGVAATDACCACGGSVCRETEARDWGGDTCAYYELHPEHCGCCDTSNFTAGRDCCLCRSFNATGIDPASVIASWPRKATRLPTRLAEYTSDELAELAARCPDLEEVNLQGTGLRGVIPPELGSLGRLRSLKLGGNELRGGIPPELGKLGKLEQLWLHDNFLSGGIPSEFGRLTSLRSLFLDSNRLTGSAPPALGDLASLESLWLYNNSLSGSIPSEFGGFPLLRELDLHTNRLNGSLPPELGKLGSLEYLMLYDNALSGRLPSALGGLAALRSLHLFANRLSGSLPPELGKLGSLEQMYLHDNALDGSLPSELGGLASLSNLALQSNRLSGPLPPQLGNLSRLTSMQLGENSLSASIPSELGGLVSLYVLELYSNQLSGSLPPELGNLSSLESIFLDANSLSGNLPPEFGKLGKLFSLNVSFNEHLTGSLALLQGMDNLWRVYAQGCSFTAAAGLPPRLEVLDLSGNKFRAIPSEWHTHDSLRILRLDSNRIATWELSGVLADDAFAAGSLYCEGSFIRPQLSWRRLLHFNVSRNPLGVRARDFLHSLAYLPSLVSLDAASCGLHGEIPQEYGQGLAPAFAGNEPCSQGTIGFQSLLSLDLSNNEITGLATAPSNVLRIVDLSGNNLSSLRADWYNERGRNYIASLNARGNPELRRHISISESGTCPIAGTDRLLANPLGFAAEAPGSAYECTTLCPGAHTLILSDPALNATALCRCRRGYGVGTACTDCPNDTFSELHFVDGHYQRTCRSCPSFSELRGGAGESHHECQCEAGFYMVDVDEGKDAPYGECVRCPQWPFRTTVIKGASSESDCTCNPEFANLLGSGGRCGCQDGYFMDHANRVCSPCSIHEFCLWGVDGITDSLEPPRVKAGFWALPPPGADGLERRSFSGHSIWKCTSKDTCLSGSECGPNREGRACGLCKPQHYGSFSGPCRRCKYPARTARGLLTVGMAAAVPLPFLAHVWLEIGAAGPAGMGLKLRPFKTGMFQFFHFLQVWGIISAFQVEWPRLVMDFLSIGASVSTEVPNRLGSACLGDAQSIELELGLRWLAPLALACVIGISVAFFVPCHAKLQAVASRIPMLQTISVRMGPLEGLRVLALGVKIFYATLLQWGLLVFSCIPSPNGQFSLARFPHVRCDAGEASWVMLAVIGCLYTVLVLALFPMGLYLGWCKAAQCSVESRLASKGWWQFWFEPYRPVEMSWALWKLAYDIALNLASVVAVGYGTVQLLLAGLICAVSALKAAHLFPYYKLSNTILEVWYRSAAAAICFVTAAAGFQTDPQRGDVSALLPGGKEGSEYEKLMAIAVSILWLSLICPAIVMTYQFLTAFDRMRWLIPYRFRPLEPEEHEELVEDLCSSLGVEGKLKCVLQGLDHIEIWSFWCLMTYRKPTLGMAGLQSQMSPLNRFDGDFIRRVRARRRPGRPAGETEGAAEDGEEAKLRQNAKMAADEVKTRVDKLSGAQLQELIAQLRGWLPPGPGGSGGGAAAAAAAAAAAWAGEEAAEAQAGEGPAAVPPSSPAFAVDQAPRVGERVCL